VFAPNPSIVLVYLLLVLRSRFRFRLAIDAHYAGVVAAGGSAVLQKALDYCNRRADLVIVTNEDHGRRVEALGGRPLVCEDPLPDIASYAAESGDESRSVLFICSFDVDEPYAAVLQAAAILRAEGYAFWVSGDFARAAIDPSGFPHVNFMGYVPEPEFYARLARSQVVVDLTDHENCLVCGAYEAMMLEKPLVTSKTRALQRYFGGAAVFVEHHPAAIADGVRLAYEARSEWRRRIGGWKIRAAADNEGRIEAIRRRLNLRAPAEYGRS
jgi:glycosyltransferase involved in cell wall biosynthesis